MFPTAAPPLPGKSAAPPPKKAAKSRGKKKSTRDFRPQPDRAAADCPMPGPIASAMQGKGVFG